MSCYTNPQEGDPEPCNRNRMITTGGSSRGDRNSRLLTRRRPNTAQTRVGPAVSGRPFQAGLLVLNQGRGAFHPSSRGECAPRQSGRARAPVGEARVRPMCGRWANRAFSLCGARDYQSARKVGQCPPSAVARCWLAAAATN